MSNSSGRSLVAGSAATLIGAAASALLSTAYISLGARWLGPDGYGAVAATIAGANLFFMALHPLETGLTLRVAAFTGRDEPGPLRSFLVRSQRGLLVAGAAGLLLWLALLALLPAFTTADDAASLRWLGVFCAAALVQCIPRSGYRGREMFGMLAANQILEALLRMVIGLGLLWLGAGPAGMLAGYALATVVAVVHGALTMCSGLVAQDAADRPGALFSWEEVLLPFRSLSAPLLGLNVYMGVVVNVDVLAAKYFLPAHEAGLYAGASSVARIVAVGASPLLMVLFSRLAVLSAAKRETGQMLRVGTLAVVGVLGLSLVVPALGGHLVLRGLLGEAYESAQLVLLYQWTTACVVVTHVFLADSMLATSRVRAGWLFVLPALGLLLSLSVLHDSALVIARTTLCVCAGLGTAVYALLWRWRTQPE